MSSACFEYLEGWLGSQQIGRSIDMKVQQRHNQVCVGGIDLPLSDQCYGFNTNSVLTGVTRRGVKRTYSANVGSWMRYAEPLFDQTSCRGSFPITSACFTTPLWLCVVFEACNFTSTPSWEASFLSRSSTTSPSAWL
jgi:hypothetical protein